MMEVINNIPTNAIELYTDESKINELTGSGICVETSRRQLTLSRRNPDSSSVFRSELIAINEGLELVKSEGDFHDLWILTDSRSSLQTPKQLVSYWR
ncbi:RNase H domain-containing protein [Trichonephila clavipes]|nr:RNase H domain-containing protein [Trichonephila clavipes]